MLKTILLALCLSLVCSGKPNVLFYLTDDQGWQDWSFRDHPYVLTPNMDSIAKEGVAVTNFYVCSPVCGASRAAFLLGRYPAYHGIESLIGPAENEKSAANGVVPLLSSDITMLKWFKACGYQVRHWGKWHVYGADEGGTVSTQPSSSWLKPYGLDELKSPNAGYEATHKSGWWKRSDGQISTDIISFLEKHDGNLDKPFFIQMHSSNPHAPVITNKVYRNASLKPNPRTGKIDKRFYNRFGRTHDQQAASIEGYPRNFSDDTWDDFYFSEEFHGKRWKKSWKYNGLEDKTPQGHFNEASASYYGKLSEMDYELGLVIQKLKDKGLYDNTIIVFASDNGPEVVGVGDLSPGMGLSDGRRGRKRSLNEGGIIVPFAICGPGIPSRGSDNRTVMTAVDLWPTLAAACGIRVPPGIDGRNVLPYIKGEERQPEREDYWRTMDSQGSHAKAIKIDSPQLAIRKGYYKYMQNRNGSRPELYDLKNDPKEEKNLVNYEFAKVAELKVLLEKWNDTLPGDAPKLFKQTTEINPLPGDTFKMYGFFVGGTIDQWEKQSDPIKYQWSRNGKIIEDDFYFTGSNTRVLTINSWSESLGGEYICTATNSAGSASIDAIVLAKD